MWKMSGLIHILGLILITGTTEAFRFPNEGRGRILPHTRLVPPPPHGSRLVPHHQQQQQPQPVQHQQVTSRKNSFRFPSYPPRTVQQQVTSRHPQQQPPQPRKLQWDLPVKTLQQSMGYDEPRPEASNQVRHAVPVPSSTAGGVHSLQPTAGAVNPSNNPPSYILTIGEASEFCQRCEMLNSMASAACCSGQSRCCQQSIPYQSHSQFHQQAPQSNYPLQGPPFGQVPFYQQRNSHQQGPSHVPARQHFYTENVNIYNKYDSQFNHGNVEPAYDIQVSEYEDQDFPDDEYPTEDDPLQGEFDSNRDRRSSLGDFVAGAAISMISLAVRMAARGGLDDGDLGEPQRQHRMIG